MVKVTRQKGESIDNLLRRYKRRRARADIQGEIMKRSEYAKPSERRRRKHALAVSKQRNTEE